MIWESYKKGFKAYLQLEKSLSDHSVEAYLQDFDKLVQFLEFSGVAVRPAEITLTHLRKFIKWIGELGFTPSSQARILSGIRSFFKYCVVEQIISSDPTILLDSPKLKRALPDVLSFEEIER